MDTTPAEALDTALTQALALTDPAERSHTVAAVLAETVQAVIGRALALDEPTERARAITGILGVVKDSNAELKTTRQHDVLALRKTMTLREIGEAIGSSTARVDQIAKGK